MNHAIPSGGTRPVPGQDKEEPELSYERDIPTDDDGPGATEDADSQKAPSRDAERE